MKHNTIKPFFQVLYDTERYHTSNFGYDLPVETDGDYILQLKFCEVYFNEERKKVFDVVLNSEHTILTDLDIFATVGKGNAHDEYIKFSISDGKLFWKDEESEVFDGKIRLDFMKQNNFDNPKCNAFILYKGEDLENIPKLKDLSEIDEELEEEGPKQTAEEEQANILRVRRTSGPKQPDPYSTDDPSSIMMPVLIAIACFIPLLFCLCKL
uniref:Malectin domain-containing protein n=1 Tax=Megaselia scalaris TaxID=36166 RepID=T1GXZ9_MEGSC